jgi:transcriptional regulator with XRE-family HTH domain
VTPDDGDDAGGGDDFARGLGAQLRAVRTQQRLSLKAAAARSAGEVTASLLGAWERGERRVSVERLAALADLYGVPVDRLLPTAPAAPAGETAVPHEAKVRADLDVLRRHDDPTATIVLRFAEAILRRRHDLNGHVATIRRSDLDALAATTGQSTAALLDDLVTRGLVRVEGDRGR